jgi:hypothetical protein
MGSLLPILLPFLADILKRVIPDPVEREKAQAQIEAQVREADARAMEAQAQAFRDAMQLAVAETQKPGWWSAWRPAFAWLCVVAFACALIVFPVWRAFGVAIEMDQAALSQITTVFLTLYMGGHTAKYVADQWREARRDR